MEQLKVSTKSNPNSVAGAMAGVLRHAGVVDVQVVGAGALNQAIKAVAIARGYVAASGIDLICVPTFADIEIDGERRTAIRLTIEDRTNRGALASALASAGAGAGDGAPGAVAGDGAGGDAAGDDDERGSVHGSVHGVDHVAGPADVSLHAGPIVHGSTARG